MYKRLIIFLFVGFHFIAITQELSYNHYTVHDGLAQMQIEDLLLDSQGALWVATRGGVSRFNGYSFDSFEDLNSRPGYCTEIIEDSKGQIIILGSDGVYLFNGRAFTFYKAPDNYRFNHLASMDVDDAGVVWINAYNASPILFKDSIYINLKDEYPKHQIDSVGQVFFHDQSKSLLIEMYRKGIFKLTQDTLIPVFKTDNGTRVISTHIDGSNSGQFFLREFDNSKSKFFSIDNELQIVHLFNEQLGEITAIENPIDQDVLFTERPVNNLFILEKGQSRSSKLISDLNGKFNYPGEVYVDDVGNFYLESDKGLIIINANRFEKVDESKVSNAWSINQLANGDMFFGGYGSGFKILDGEGIEKEVSIKERYYCKTGTISAQLQYIYMGSTIGFEGDLIIPTQETLLKFKDGEFRVFDYSKACKTMPSLYVFSDNTNKRILSATCNGLRILNENGELLRIVKEGLFDHRCLLTINQDKQDNYWIGATGGIAKYNYNTEVIKNYTKVNGGFPFNGVVCTYIDHKGTLWAGSREGLTYFDDKKDKFFAVEDFIGTEVASMITGDDNQLFLSTSGALLELDLKSFYQDDNVLYRVYDKNNGLGIIGSGQNGFFKDTEGRIWCTSDTEVYRFHPDNLKGGVNESIPNIAKVNGDRVAIDSRGKTIEIFENENNLSIEFESIGLNSSNNLTYSYLLDGYDDKWSEYSKYNNCTYNNLSSGNYTFKIKNNQSNIIAQQEIEIDIPFYREPHFGGFAGIASISFLLLSILFGRNYSLEKKNNKLLKIQEQQIQTEKQNLELLHQLEKENKALLEEQNKKLVFQKSELEGINQRLQLDIAAIRNRQSNKDQKLEIKTKGKLNYVQTNELMYIHAEENGCRYFMKDNSSIWNDDNLKSWEGKLDPRLFVRIHRSTLVQKEYISKVSYNKLNLVDGTELKVGRKYKENL